MKQSNEWREVPIWKVPDSPLKSKRYWAVFFILCTIVLPELPVCAITPYIPAAMKGCAFLAAALAGYSKFGEVK